VYDWTPREKSRAVEAFFALLKYWQVTNDYKPTPP